MVLFVLIVAFLLLLTNARTEILSAVRAYVAGEGLYSKGQKDAVYSLRRYASSGAESDYESFLSAIAIPLGDRRAREELEKPSPDPAVVYAGFIAGHNHPEDVEDMARLFRWFRHVPYMADAIQIWAAGDAEIARLEQLGRQLRAEISARQARPERVAEILAEVDLLNERLTRLEDRFSQTLGEGNRTITRWLVRVTYVATALLLAGGFLLSWILLRQIAAAQQALQAAHDRTAALLAAAKDVSGTIELEAMLDRVHRRIAELLPCERVATAYWDPARESFRILAQYGTPPELHADAAALEFRQAEPLVRRLAAGHTVVIDAGVEQPWLPPHLLEHFGVQTIMVVPLMVHGIMIGGIVASRTPAGGRFAADAMGLFEGIAGQVGVAVQEVELYRAQREEANVAAVLARIGQELIASLDTPVLLERLCQLTAEALGCDCSHTVLFDPEQDAYVPLCSYGDTPEQWESSRLVKIPRASLSGLIAQLESYEVVQMAFAGMSPDDLVARLAAQSDVPASLFIALRCGSEIVGYQDAGYRGRPGRFSATQERIAKGIAHLASLALQNARLVEELASANRLRANFVANMSHELRSPLHIVIGYGDLLLEEAFGSVSEQQQDILRRIGSSARELLRLVDVTLDLSRLEAKRIAVDLSVFGVSELLDELTDHTRVLPDKPDLRVESHAAADLPPLYSDRLKLKMVLNNLLGNAIKFTEKGHVTVEAHRAPDGVEFIVSDSGIGIPEAALDTIFEPFHQLDNATYGGAGLGLHIVRRILELLGGTISVESAVGRGSTFRVWVPSRAPAAEARKAATG